MTNPAASLPRFLGRYELVHLLGQGGMGEVYLARLSGAAGFEKLCIVKTILPALVKDRQFLERFHHEARVLVHLVHSSIAQVYDMGEAHGTYYMALEYVAGVDLADLQVRAAALGQPLPVDVALYLAIHMAEGLGYAHRKAGPDGKALGVVHRDVSPHNVMVSYEGEVKVIDFGLAKSVERTRLSLPSTVLGKPGYMAPEQVRAEPVDHRADIFACGVVLWELLAGRELVADAPLAQMMAAMANPDVPALHALRPDVSPELDAVVRRALAPRPEERYARADDFARALNAQLLNSGSRLCGEDVGNYVRGLCAQDFQAQRRLLSGLVGPRAARAPTPAPQPASPVSPSAATRILPPRAFGASGPTPVPSRRAVALASSPGPASAPPRRAAPVPLSAPEASSEARLGPLASLGRKRLLLLAAVALGLMAATAGLTAWLVRG